MRSRLLIVITGPVGGGKSSTGLALAQALRRPDVAVAVIDLDQMYGFVRQKPGYGEQTGWTRARAGAAALANALFDSDMSVVIVEGEFFTRQELDTLLAPIHSDVRHLCVTLRLSYELALTRVQGDPSRGMSKDPTVLRSMHTYFAQVLPFLGRASTVIDTDPLSQDEVVSRLVQAVNDGDSPPVDFG
jgi:shikimate kinase